MKLFRFDREVGTDISQYSTKNVLMARIARLKGPTEIGVMHIGPRGEVARHEATVPQLFMVMQGAGHISIESNRRRAITVGQAIFLDKGEMYELGSDYGLVAVVLEVEGLDPTELMKELA